MRVLAIDTALEACSAAVLDIAQPQAMVHETLPMARGHAEALMPMIDRVVQKSGLQYEDFDRDRGNRRARLVHRPAGRHRRRARDCACGRQARDRALDAGSAAAPLIAEDDSGAVVSAIDARHDHVYLQVFGPGGRTLVTPRVTPVRDAVRAASSGAPRIIGSGAELLAKAWPSDAKPPSLVDPRRFPDIDWVARLGAAALDTGAPPKPLYLRAPDAQPQAAAGIARR